MLQLSVETQTTTGVNIMLQLSVETQTTTGDPSLTKQNVIDIGKTNSKAVSNSDGTTKEGGSDCGN